MLRSGNNIVPGPYTFESAATFLYINENIPKDASIMFSKPRALSYFTGLKTYVNVEMTAKNIMDKEIDKYKPDYFLVNFEATDDSSKSYFSRQNPPPNVVFSNSKFILIKLGNK